MSKHRESLHGAGCRVALFFVLATLPSSAEGQTARELEVRVRGLEQEVVLAQRAEDSLRAIREAREMARFIRFRVGGLELVTVSELRSLVEAAGETAWNVLAQTYQDSIAAILRTFPIAVLSRPPDDSLVRQVWYPKGTRLVFVAEDGGPTPVAAASLLAQVTQELWLRLDRDLQDWLKSPPLISTDVRNGFAHAYLDLATSASPIAQRCLADAGHCMDALALSRPLDPAAEWYSPAGRRGLVLQLGQPFRVGDSRQSYDRCQTGSDQDCLALLREIPDQIPGVLLPQTRMSFLRVVLENGGANSYPVLLDSRGRRIRERFEAASSGKVDQSVAEWHRRVVGARPRPTTVKQGQAMAALGWAALLLVLALRSSRWR